MTSQGSPRGTALALLISAAAAVAAAVLTRLFLDWNEAHYPWRRIYLELAFEVAVPALAAVAGWKAGGIAGLLLVAGASAAAVAGVVAHHYAAPLGYDNADSLVVAAFVSTTLFVFALGMLAPLLIAVASLMRSLQDLVKGTAATTSRTE